MCSCFQFNSLLNFTSVRSFVRWYSLLLQYSISVFFVIFSLNSYLVTLFLFFVIKWSPARTPSSLRWWKLGNVCTCSFACQGKSTHDVNDRNSIRKKQIHQKSFQHLRLRLQIHSLPLLSWFDGAWPTTCFIDIFWIEKCREKIKVNLTRLLCVCSGPLKSYTFTTIKCEPFINQVYGVGIRTHDSLIEGPLH